MFFLGVLAIFQILFFPGLIFRSLYQPKGKLFFQISVIVATSMLANFLLFYPLIYIHLYTRTVVLVFIGLEVLAILWLYRSIFRTRLDDLGQRIQKSIEEVKGNISAWFTIELPSPFIHVLRSLVIAVFLILAVSLVYWFFRRLPNGFGSVFNEWDAIFSWNAWAQSWAQGQIPNVHFTYPQILPINLSITYLLTGNFQVSLFAKAIMPIFALLTVLTVLELAVSEKKYGYLLGVVLIYLLYKKFLGTIITDGYADVPVAFMAWIALIPYLRNEDILSDKKEFFLSLILAAAAALTKQVGLYIIVLLPVMAFLNSNTKSKKLVRLCLVGLALGILLVLPWYLPRAIQVNTGVQDLGLERYMSHSTDVQDTDNLLLRPFLAMVGLGKYLIPYVFSLVAIPFLKRRWRLLVIFFIIPFSLLWGVVASYSVRNLSVTFPALAIIVGLAAQVCLDFGWGLFSRIKAGKLSASLLLLVILAPILYYGFKLDDETVLARWREAQSQIFSPEINAQIYALDYSLEGCKSILTNYPVSYLPGLEDRMVEFYFNDFGMYQNLVADPSICWMLVPINRALDSVNDDIKARLDDGSYQLIFESDNWVPYELIKIR